MKKTYRIQDMHCGNCAMRLQELEDTLPGVISVSASYSRQTLVLDFSSEPLDDERVVSAVKELGYTAIPVE